MSKSHTHFEFILQHVEKNAAKKKINKKYPSAMQNEVACPTGPPGAPQGGCWSPIGLESHIPALSGTEPTHHLPFLF